MKNLSKIKWHRWESHSGYQPTQVHALDHQAILFSTGKADLQHMRVKAQQKVAQAEKALFPKPGLLLPSYSVFIWA